MFTVVSFDAVNRVKRDDFFDAVAAAQVFSAVRGLPSSIFDVYGNRWIVNADTPEPELVEFVA